MTIEAKPFDTERALVATAMVLTAYNTVVHLANFDFQSAAINGIFSLSAYKFLHRELESPQAAAMIVNKADYSAENNLLQQSIDQYKPKFKADHREVVFVVLPICDPNNALSMTSQPENIHSIVRLAKMYRIEWVRAENVSDITASMKKVNKAISHLIFMGHGDYDSVQLGEEGRMHQSEIGSGDFPNLSPYAHILFQSCSTGCFDGIAEKFSAIFPRATCFAPESVCYPSHTWFYWTKKGPAVLHLSSRNQQVLTRIFHGKTVETLPVSDDMTRLIKVAIEPGKGRMVLGSFLCNHFPEGCSKLKLSKLVHSLAAQGHLGAKQLIAGKSSKNESAAQTLSEVASA